MIYRRCNKGLAILIMFCLLVGLPGNAFAFTGADNQPPQLNRAKIVGTLLTLEFNELLKAIPTRDPGLFTIKVNGTAQAQPRSAVVVLKNVVINLADTVNPGDHVAISYQSGNKGIEDFAGNKAAAFDDYLVENHTPDLIPPLIEEVFVDGA